MTTKRKTATRRKSSARPGSRQARKKAGVTYAQYLRVVKKLPGVEESTSYGTPSVKVKGKVLSRLRTEAEGALALMCDFVDRELLLQAAPDTFFITDHYRNYPMILVRLECLRPDALEDLVERAWRLRAPPKLIAQFDAAEG